jgi:RHS repeat-associated protein
MRSAKTRSQTTVNIVMLVILLLPLWPFASAIAMPVVEARPVVARSYGKSLSPMEGAIGRPKSFSANVSSHQARLPSSLLLEEAQRQVVAQTASPEPRPNPIEQPLEPGTQPAQEEGINRIYLPFVARQRPGDGGGVELIDLRTQYSKTFQRPDGSGYALSYMEPVHYLAADGTWHEIDNTLIQVLQQPDVYQNAANGFVVQISDGDASEPQSTQASSAHVLRLIDSSTQLELLPLHMAQVNGEIVGQTATYTEVMPGVDLSYSTLSDGLALDYVLREASEDLLLDMQVRVTEGELEIQDGAFVLMHEDTVLWRFEFSSLTADEQVPAFSWGLTDLGGGAYQLQVIIDGAWLREMDVEFPVHVTLRGTKSEKPISTDATGTRADNRDAYAQEGYPTTPAGNQFNLYLGYDTWYGKARTRIFARFNPPNLPPGTTITNARAYLYQYVAQAGGTYNTRVCRITQDWGEYTLTWNNQPNITSCSGYAGTGNGVGWKYWTITSYAQAWQSGTSNHGIFLQAQNELAPGGVYYSRDCVSQCPGGERPYMWLEYTLSPVLRIYDGLDLSPAANVVEGTTVTADFWVRNNGGATFNGQLRAYTNGTPTFPEQSVSISPNGGTYHYQKTQTFDNPGTFTVCAQYRDSSWHNLTADGGVTCRTLNVVPHETTDVRLTTDLELVPSELEPEGGTVRARFTVRNTGSLPLTEDLRAQVTDGSDFATDAGVTLNALQTHTYDETRAFTEPGIYEVIAEHKVEGSWYGLLGVDSQDPSGFVRVKLPPPPPPQEDKGKPPDDGFAGEPVNTSTGNYFFSFTDLSDPTPGLSLDVTRLYNALDAPEVEGPFGHGTSWTYNMTVTWRVDKSALVRMPDGHLGYFLGEIDPDDPAGMAGIYHGQERDVGNTLMRAIDGTAVLTMAEHTAYHFDATGRLTQVTHPQPAEITVVYSGTVPIALVHSAGMTYTLTYSGSQILRIASSTGRVVEYVYTPAGDLSSITRPDGSTYTYIYDGNHRLTEGQDPNGHAFVRNVYDEEGRVILQYDQTGQASTFFYGPDLAITAEHTGALETTTTRVYTDALGYTTTHTYDAEHRLIEEVDALGYSITYTRDDMGNVLTKQDKDGALWQYTYDERGNLLSEVDPLGNTWSYTYDERNNRTSQTDPLGNTWTYDYYDNDQLRYAKDPLAHVRKYVYDDQGNLIREQDEELAVTLYAYNDLGLRTVITDALGHVTYMGYDALGNQTSYTDANGRTATFVYDGLNRLLESMDPMGTVITYTYDAMGNLLTESDGLGYLKHYAYDEYDRLVAETDFNGNTTRYGYDALGRRTVVTDALGYETRYTYDAVGNLIARQDKDGTITRFEYDPVGRLIREIDPLDRATEYVYDPAGRQVEVRRPCDVCPGGVAVSRTEYDAAGRMVGEVDARGATTYYMYDPVSRLAAVSDPLGYQTTYSYDRVGRLLQEVDPIGAITQYEYDEVGQLITTTNALGFQTVNGYDAVGNRTLALNACCGATTTYAYDANDQLVTTTDALGHVTHNEYDAEGRLVSTTDPLGRTTAHEYDANGNQTAVTDSRGHTTRTEYDALNRPVRRIDPLDSVTLTTYDPMGRVVAETDALGYMRIFTYDLAGRRVVEQSPLGNTTVYTYDSADNLVTRQDPDGAIWRFEYDANGNQVRQVDPLGGVYETEYDLLDRAVRETDPLGAVTLSEYDAAGRLITSTDPRGAVTRYEYDLLGQQIRQTNPLGFTQDYTYDGRGNLVSAQDERGFITSYVYDELDRQIAQTDPLGHTSYSLFDAAGQVTATIDYNGQATEYAYDDSGNQVLVTDPLGEATTTAYDELNRPVAVTDPLGRVRTTSYDAHDRVTGETTAGGYTTAYVYDADGRRTSRTDPLGNTWTTEYDAAGRPIREIDPLSRVRTTTYDGLGRVTARTDPLGRTTQYRYDPLGRLTEVVGPDNTTQRYTYDPVGNLLTEQDGNGNVTRFQYDLLNRLARKIDPLGKKWSYQYDAAGNRTGTATPAGHAISQAYDALGRLEIKAYDGAQVVAYAYDANGNRTAMTDALGISIYSYDSLNRLVSSTDAAGRTAGYGYDAAGQRVSLTYPDGAMAHYAYDADGHLSRVTAPDGGVTVYERDALGRPVRLTQANGVVVEYTYDAAGNLLSIVQKDASGAVLARHEYIVDDADRRVQKVEALLQGTVTAAYGYDDLDRLTDSVASDGRETHYTFDSAGNRVSQAGMRLREDSPETYQVDYAYNAANQLLEAVDSVLGGTRYTYDDDGYRIALETPVLRTSYDYDAEGHLVKVGVEEWTSSEWAYRDGVYERYAYDGNGRRVNKESWLADGDSLAARRAYRYDDTTQWDVLQTYDAVLGAEKARFLYDQPLHKLAYWQGGESGYLQNDVLGSVLGATDGAGSPAASEGLMRYDDYGQELGPESALPTEDGFTGYEREAYSGLNYARNRYYDPATGTFIGPDPFPADHEDLFDLHRYLYVQGNPVNAIDPWGLFVWTSSSSGIIEWGDTLWGIAAEYWGVSPNQVNWNMISAIQSFNSWIQNPNLIYAGHSLKLPTPLSAYSHLVNIGQSATGTGTGGSECGQHSVLPPGGTGGGNNGGGGSGDGGNVGGGGSGGSSGDGGGSGGGNSDPYRVLREKLQKIEGLPDFHWQWQFNHSVEIPDWVFDLLKGIPISLDLKGMGFEFQFETKRANNRGLYCVQIDSVYWIRPPVVSGNVWWIVSIGNRHWGKGDHHCLYCEDGSSYVTQIGYYTVEYTISAGDPLGVVSIGLDLEIGAYYKFWSGTIGANIQLDGKGSAGFFWYREWNLFTKQWHPQRTVSWLAMSKYLQ